MYTYILAVIACVWSMAFLPIQTRSSESIRVGSLNRPKFATRTGKSTTATTEDDLTGRPVVVTVIADVVESPFKQLVQPLQKIRGDRSEIFPPPVLGRFLLVRRPRNVVAEQSFFVYKTHAHTCTQRPVFVRKLLRAGDGVIVRLFLLENVFFFYDLHGRVNTPKRIWITWSRQHLATFSHIDSLF